MKETDLIEIGFKETTAYLPTFRINDVLSIQACTLPNGNLGVHLYYDANGLYLCLSKTITNIESIKQLINLL